MRNRFAVTVVSTVVIFMVLFYLNNEFRHKKNVYEWDWSRPESGETERAVPTPPTKDFATTQRENLVVSLSNTTDLLNQQAAIISTLGSQLMELENGPLGSKIAASAEQVENYLVLLNFQQRLKKLNLEQMDRLGRLKTDFADSMTAHALEQRTIDSGYLRNDVDENARNIDRASLSFKAMVHAGESLPQAESTLQNAIAARQISQKAADNVETEKYLSAYKKKRDAELMQLEQERDAVELQIRTLQMQLAEQDDRRKALEARVASDQISAREKATAAEANLNSEFEREKYKMAILQPLFVASDKQPAGAATELTRKKKPTSLAALRSCGALQEGLPGLSALALAICIGRNDADYAPLPRYNGIMQEKHLVHLRPAHEFLRKYQYLLVKKGLLAP